MKTKFFSESRIRLLKVSLLMLLYQILILNILFFYFVNYNVLFLEGGGRTDSVWKITFSNPYDVMKYFIKFIVSIIAEELIFRKWILVFLEKWNIKLKNTIQAILFAVIHTHTFFVIDHIIFALILGNIYMKDRKLRYTIFLHLQWNCILILLIRFFPDFFIINSFIHLVILSFILLGAIYYLFKKIDINLLRL